jgi:hypothetical protein
MSLSEIVHQVLTTGILPMSLERKMHQLLNSQEIQEADIDAIDQLIEAMLNGSVRPVA